MSKRAFESPGMGLGIDSAARMALALVLGACGGGSPSIDDSGASVTDAASDIGPAPDGSADAGPALDAGPLPDGGPLLDGSVTRPGCTEAQVFVSTTGDDAAAGTLDAPLATLSGARDRVRALIAAGRPSGPIVVCVRGGDYVLSASFSLSAQDSGEAGRPIVYQGYAGEVVRILGGSRVPRTSFSPVTQVADPDAWDRLDESARTHVMKADVSGMSADFGNFDRRLHYNPGRMHNDAMELFYRGKPMTLGRYPDFVDPSTLPRYPESVVLEGQGLSPDPTGRYVQAGMANGRPRYVSASGEFQLEYGLGSRNYLLTRVGASDIVYYSAPLPTAEFTQYRGDLGGRPYGRWERNIGFEYITGVRSPTELNYSGTRPSRWSRALDPMLFGYFRFGYRPFHVRVRSIDTSRGTYVVEEPSEGARSPRRYFAYNLLEEISVPGEYYLDRSDGSLYFWPPDDALTEDPWVSVLDDPLLVIDGAEYVVLSGLNFEIAKDDLIDVRSNNVTLEYCDLRNAGGAGLRLRGSNNVFSHSEIADVGGSGIWLAGGNRNTLTPSGSEVSDSRIHDFARLFWSYQAGIRMVDGEHASHRDSVGHRVIHNEIFGGPHQAIGFQGNDHLIAFNDIHDVCRLADDMGAIYTYLSWGSRGVRIENNFIHDIQSPLGGRVHGVYLDGTTSGPRVSGNIFYNINPGIALFHNGGRDVEMVNNIFVGNGTALATNASGARYSCSFSNFASILSEMDRYSYQSDPWASAYPRLAAMPSTCGVYESTPHWLCPEGNVYSRNVGFSNFTWIYAKDSSRCDPTLDEFADVSGNLEDTDPLFVDEASGDFSLRPDSPLRTIAGFESYRFDDIGPRP